MLCLERFELGRMRRIARLHCLLELRAVDILCMRRRIADRLRAQLGLMRAVLRLRQPPCQLVPLDNQLAATPRIIR